MNLRPEVPTASVNVTQNNFTETGSVVSKTQSDRAKVSFIRYRIHLINNTRVQSAVVQSEEGRHCRVSEDRQRQAPQQGNKDKHWKRAKKDQNFTVGDEKVCLLMSLMITVVDKSQ